jgi:hypothetical protein
MNSHRPFCCRQLEQLERRDAPASYVNSTTLTYQDADGDNVRVTFSRPLLTPANVGTIFTFNAFGVTGSNAFPQQLWEIDLNSVGAGANGIGIKVSATRSPITGGDGFAHVGYIDAATGIPLGAVNIDGDLGRIKCGAAGSNVGLTSLRVASIGQYLLDTQGGAGDLVSIVLGDVRTLVVRGNVREAFFSVENAGAIRSARIGGSIIGGIANSSGRLQAQGGMATVFVGGSLIGGGGNGSGAIAPLPGGGSFTVRGSLIGAAGGDSGSIQSSFGNIGRVSVGGDLRGISPDSGAIIVAGNLGQAIVRGSLQGGGTTNSGSIVAAGTTGAVRVAGNIRGGTGGSSGSILSDSRIGSVSVAGSVFGGSGLRSGSIYTDDAIGSVAIGGSVVGSATNPVVIAAGGSGNPAAVVLAKITIGGSATYLDILAGYTDFGPHSADASIGSVHVRGDWIASNILAGVDPGLDGAGNLNDAAISGPGTVDSASAISHIARVVIGGQAMGSTPTLGDHFGFVAQHIGSFKVGNTNLPLNSGPHDGLETYIGITGDLSIREVPL